jgi:hypothetical protein
MIPESVPEIRVVDIVGLDSPSNQKPLHSPPETNTDCSFVSSPEFIDRPHPARLPLARANASTMIGALTVRCSAHDGLRRYRDMW